MGEILGLGVTHQPTLTAKDVRPGSLRGTLRDPGLPEEYRTPDGWPAPMREEWGDDEGASGAARHREALLPALRHARQVLDDFAPDLVVIWGDDQYENFREDIIPPFCVLAYDRFEAEPWKGRRRENAWDEPEDRRFVIEGHRAGAKHLATRLLEQEIDISYAYQPLHHGLGHAFLNTVLYLDWDRTGFPYPIVPFQVNSYGRNVIATKGAQPSLSEPVPEEDLDPPSPSPGRCFDVGAATARAFRDSDLRVALVASASWSHAFLTRKNFYLHPDHAADRRMFEALKQGDYDAWRATTLDQIEDSGQQEMLNWYCLAGAMAELGRTPDHATMIETWTMNSNKVVATFLP